MLNRALGIEMEHSKEVLHSGNFSKEFININIDTDFEEDWVTCENDEKKTCKHMRTMKI